VGSGSWSLFPRRAALFLRREIAWFGVSSFDVTRRVVWIRSTSQLLRQSPAPGGSELPTGSCRVALTRSRPGGVERRQCSDPALRHVRADCLHRSRRASALNAVASPCLLAVGPGEWRSWMTLTWPAGLPYSLPPISEISMFGIELSTVEACGCLYILLLDCFSSVCSETMTVMCVYLAFKLGMAFIKLQLRK